MRLLIGELQPDTGKVRVGADVRWVYYDQQREQLDPERSVFDTIGQGNDTITVNGRSRHVNGYLRDFLFPPERAQAQVRSLSGGERNRLLMARLFTQPANVLILDEPTNDLDVETLELLEAQLAEFPGTLLLVTHDRVFLDNAVTSTLVFDGRGQVLEYVGGYGDWLRQRAVEPIERARNSKPVALEGHGGAPKATGTVERRRTARTKLSYSEQRQLEQLPLRIEKLEGEQSGLNGAFANPEFYKAQADIRAKLSRLEEVQKELLEAYARWEELESRSG
jgi:ABC transport system ATP-binding/permease protein